jgi:probable F420-dependent oxidoreductase
MQGAHRPFRFGVQLSHAASHEQWKEQARRAEALGFDIALMPDHLGTQFAVGPALAIIAEATTTLRIGTFVLQNDLRHPAFVAMEAATLDLLSGGRFELGLGAGGSLMSDFEKTGIPFDPPGTRVGRLAESVPILKSLFAGGPVTVAGDFYTITDFESFPKPIQSPHPPILVAGGGPRVLALAAREADIVGILAAMLPAGGAFQMEQLAAEGVDRQVALLRQAAGSRFADLELNVLIQQVRVTDDAPGASEELSQEWVPLTAEQIRHSPYLLVGTIDEIVAALQARRERHGISYIVVFERDMEAFAPVVARLAGT